MNVKNLILTNAFQTAEAVYTVVQLHEELGVDVDILIQDISSLECGGIKDKAFAETLFQYILRKDPETLIQRFFEHYLLGESPMTALSSAVV